jgi:thiol-disulfide isomerase/thioredoxin
MCPVSTWILLVLGVALLWLVLRRFDIAPRWVLLLAVPFLVVLALVSIGERPSSENGRTGEYVDLSGSFRTLDGRTVYLTDYSGKVLFLNVWATWCGPCRMEMPSMAALYRDFSGQGLAMVAVSDEDAQTVTEYLRQNPYPFTILLDPERILARRFGINAIPTTLVVDSQGRLAVHHVGFNDWNSASARNSISELLSHD